MTEVLIHSRLMLAFFAFIVLSLAGTGASTQMSFDAIGLRLHYHQAWGQTSEIFPNATTAMLGNRSLIPGMHVMSLVNDIKSTWLIISSDNELSVNMRYEGTTNLTAPAVSLLATALQTTTSATAQVPSVGTYERGTGTNITQAGWSSPITVPLLVEGNLSLYDADLIVVMIVPYTGLPLMNSTTAVLPQGNLT